LTSSVAEARAWLFEHALPLWSGAGLDRRFGGSVERLNLAGEDDGAPFKRVRVQARQVYAFSQAAVLGGSGAEAAADHAWAFLRRARLQDGAWARRLSREGEIIDATADAYDGAFVLYALAWRHRLGDPLALALAHEAFEALDRRLAFGPDEGWRAAEDHPARLQNPHMHLLEACLEWADAARDDRFAARAIAVLELFRRRMIEPGLGVFGELYDDGWRPARGPDRRIEPGHLYEWIWLLHKADRVLGLDHRAITAVLYAFAEQHGVDAATGLICDSLDGEALEPRRSFRIWPQTEALKARLAMLERSGLDTRAQVEVMAGLLLSRHLAVDPRGGWQDQLGPALEPLVGHMPTSSFYHLVLAFSELMRLEPQLGG
jgi:N-acylglucosamine 2-epimerase/mannose-6-phosphate isomerase